MSCVQLIKVLIFVSVLFTQLYARETFEFNLGQKINILSDKAFRKTSQNEFEAVGNVVITHLKNSIYGEKARINFTTGDTEVLGNVRYIAPDVTLYGSLLKYNVITREIVLDNARVISENLVVTGKKINQPKPNLIYAEEAEYTTCKDCPESWSIYGKKVTITLGQYVKIKHAFVKMNGVVVMYFPYIVFPIKQKRESGLLFPFFGFNSKEGVRYQQPFFFAIDDYKDITLTPSTFGKRGLGGEFQYRQNIAEKTWLEINSIMVDDKVYAPYKNNFDLSGKKEFRNINSFEFHSIYKNNFNNHLIISNASDLDTYGDFDFYSKDKLLGTEVGSSAFFEGRSSLFSTTVESYFNRNLLIGDPKKFDNYYVQILPKIKLSSVPYNIFHSDYPFLKNISIGLQSELTVFKQNKIEDSSYIRNASRLDLGPYANFQLGNIGPVFFSITTKFDQQRYYFPYETDRYFSKKGIVYESEAKFELEKIYGIAYTEIKNAEDDLKNLNVKKDADSTIGYLPENVKKSDEKIYLNKLSYRHSQEFKLKHYYLSDQKFKGNSKFKNQIEVEAGQFDYIDALRAKEHSSSIVTASDSLPRSNTLEVQWNNRITRKKAKLFDPYVDGKYLRDNFEYSNVAYLDISQGVDMNIQSSELNRKLTRLYLNSGISMDKFNISLQEFYFHQNSKHKFTSDANYNFERLTLGGKFTYNSFNNSDASIIKLLGYNVLLRINDLFTVKNSLDYNLESHVVNQSYYSLLYSPYNNCWKFEFNHTKDLKEKKWGLVFYINYNDNNFTSFNIR